MGPLEPDPYELVLGLLAFSFVFLVFAKVILPRVVKMLEEREDAIDGGMERAAAINAEVEAAYTAYREEMSAARLEANHARQTAAEEGAALIAGIRAEAARERAELIANAHLQIETDRTLAEAALREDLAALATTLAGRIVGEPVDDITRNSDVVDRFFAELDLLSGEADTKSLDLNQG